MSATAHLGRLAEAEGLFRCVLGMTPGPDDGEYYDHAQANLESIRQTRKVPAAVDGDPGVVEE